MTIAVLERPRSKPTPTSAGLQTSIKPQHSTGDRLAATRILANPIPLSRIVEHDQNGVNIRFSSLAGLTAFALTAMISSGGTSSQWMPTAHNKFDGQSLVTGRSAAETCERLKEISGLTNEQLAPLLGISRRSFQAWLAGGAISARKEERLRRVLAAVEEIATVRPGAVRDSLLHREPFSLSPYDLMVDGQVDDALGMITGKYPEPEHRLARQTEPLSVQLAREEIQPLPGQARLLPSLSVILNQ